MAQFCDHDRTLRAKESGNTEFGAFGKPVPTERRAEALKHIRGMGVESAEDAWECIGLMSAAIERDQPYDAVAAGMQFVDLTGTYRLMAVLCTNPE